MDIKNLIDKVRSLKRPLNENSNAYPPIPKMLYHGQPAKYDNKGNRIEPELITKFSNDNPRFLKSDNHGFYFTPNRREAEQYAEGGNVYTCEVTLNNPYYYEHLFSYSNKGLIKSATFISTEDKETLVSNGYDGVGFLDAAYRIGEVIALFPEQIKIIKVN